MTAITWARHGLIGLHALMLANAALAVQPRITSPGITWGEVRFPASTDRLERHSLRIDGAIEQGVNFSRPGNPSSVTVFGKLDYAADSEELDFNNKLKLALGIKLRHEFAGGGVAHLGAKYEYDRRFFPQRSMQGPMLFADFYKGWVIQPSPAGGDGILSPLAYPGLTWAELRYPGSQDPAEEHDLIVEGAVEQGIDWFRRGNVVFNTFAEAEYIVDSEKLDYNNKLTLGVGMKLRFPLMEKITAQAGVKYNHTRRWESGRRDQDVIWFIGWSNTWASGF